MATLIVNSSFGDSGGIIINCFEVHSMTNESLAWPTTIYILPTTIYILPTTINILLTINFILRTKTSSAC